MNKKQYFKKVPLCSAIIFVTAFLFCGNVYGQQFGIYLRGNWQTALTPAQAVDNKYYAYVAKGNIKIGVRDKFGDYGGYTADFMITTPNKKIYRFSKYIEDSAFGTGCVSEDFHAVPQAGIYSVKVFVKKRLVISFKVK